MKTSPEVESVLSEENRVRNLWKTAPEEAEKESKALLERLVELSRKFPEEPRIATAWARTARKAGIPWEKAGPLVEAFEARFPRDPFVLSSLSWIHLDRAKQCLARGDLEKGVEETLACLKTLPHQRDPKFMALALLGLLQTIDQELPPEGKEGWEDGVVALDRTLDGLKPQMEAWLSALPQEAEPARPRDHEYEKNGGKTRIGPRLRGFYILRRLGKKASRWEILQTLPALAQKMGIQNEWLYQGEGEALLAKGAPDQALDVIRAARKRFPNSENLARQEAQVLMKLGDEKQAIDLLMETAAASRTPWAWRDLGEMILATARVPEIEGRKEEKGDSLTWAVEALQAGLSFQKPGEGGLVWKLHFQLAKLHYQMGDEVQGAMEAWLAREGRVLSGWGIGKELGEFLEANRNWIQARFEALDRVPAGENRRKAIALYHTTRRKILKRIAKRATVISLRPAYGFLKVEGLEENVFFSRKILHGKNLNQGAKVLAVLVHSYDPKKKRKSLKAVWMELDPS